MTATTPTLARNCRSFLAVGSLATIVACAARQPSAPLTPVQSRLRSDVAYLASPALAGRLTGTPGNDSLLRGEYIVIGAHYDHIGRSAILSTDRVSYRFIHPGADDNASGTAAVLELARRFAAHHTRRSILFVNFSAIVFHHRWRQGMRALSDQATFPMARIPVLGLFTDYHLDYHRPSDTVDRINFAGMEKIVDFAERFVRAVADGNERPAQGSAR